MAENIESTNDESTNNQSTNDEIGEISEENADDQNISSFFKHFTDKINFLLTQYQI